MRPQISATLAALSAAALLAVALPPSAHAATGQVIVDGTIYQDPTGCIHLDSAGVHDLANNSDGVVTVFLSNDCTGNSTGALAPGDSGHFTGASLAIGQSNHAGQGPEPVR